ncbi:MAG: hypothetical protein AAGH64_11640 [Planctomycetota bacterium]
MHTARIIAPILLLTQAASAQLVTAYTGDEAPPKNWIIDVATGDDPAGPLGKSRALASDPATDRIFEIEDRRVGRPSVSLRVSQVEPDGTITQGPSVLVLDNNGVNFRFITALAFGDGVLYAASSGNSQEGVPLSLGTIDLDTYVYTPLPTSDDAPARFGMTYDHDRGRLIIGTREGSVWSLVEFDPGTGTSATIVELPPAEGGFDGLAYGRDRVWMDCGAPCGPISVYNVVTGAFEEQLPLPRRFGNGSGGATFLESLATTPLPDPACRADLDGDSDVDLGDFGVFGASFGTSTGDPGFDRSSDLDDDGDVDLGDFGLFGSAFGRDDC